MKILVLCVILLVPHSGTAGPKDLSAGVPPRFLTHLYRCAFENTPIKDLRSEIGETVGIRLFCLNDRFPSYAFSIMDDGTPTPWIEWIEFKKGETKPQSISSGKRVLSEREWSSIELSAEANEFTELPCAALPVSIGHPYTFMIEVFGEGTYKVVYRDTPDSQETDRGLAGFNKLSSQIIRASGITTHKFRIPGAKGDKPSEQAEDDQAAAAVESKP